MSVRPTQGDSGLPLDYRSAEADRSAVGKGQVASGIAVSVVVVIVAVAGGIFAELDGAGKRAIVVGWVVTALVLNGIAFVTYRRPHRRGWAIGLWIGFGLGLLVEGICFGVLDK